jgi:hypothetical protein
MFYVQIAWWGCLRVWCLLTRRNWAIIMMCWSRHDDLFLRPHSQPIRWLGYTWRPVIFHHRPLYQPIVLTTHTGDAEDIQLRVPGASLSMEVNHFGQHHRHAA